MVTVTDYETQAIRGAKFYTYNGTNELGQPTYIANGPTYWFEDGFTQDDLKNIISEGMKNADENGLYNGVYYGNYQNVTKTEKVEVGSHQEDQGYYEEYIDYQYCSICGAKKSKLPFKRVVCSEAISLAYLLASQGAAFTSFKLTAFDSRCPSKGLFLYFPFAPFFSFVLFNASCSAFENGFAYSFTLNLSIA